MGTAYSKIKLLTEAAITRKKLSTLILITTFLTMTILGCSQVNLRNPLPDLKATEQALTAIVKTQQVLLNTAQALATRVAGGPVEPTPTPSATLTLMPTATHTPSPTLTPTQVTPSLNAPADIPVLSGDVFNYFSTQNFVSYETTLSLNEVATFYDTEMAGKGWVKNTTSSVQSTSIATLFFEKPDRSAKISMQVNSVAKRTSVIVSITNR